MLVGCKTFLGIGAASDLKFSLSVLVDTVVVRQRLPLLLSDVQFLLLADSEHYGVSLIVNLV